MENTNPFLLGFQSYHQSSEDIVISLEEGTKCLLLPQSCLWSDQMCGSLFPWVFRLFIIGKKY